MFNSNLIDPVVEYEGKNHHFLITYQFCTKYLLLGFSDLISHTESSISTFFLILCRKYLHMKLLKSQLYIYKINKIMLDGTQQRRGERPSVVVNKNN